MSKSALKLPSLSSPSEPPVSPHTRQSSLNIARSPLISPSTSHSSIMPPSGPILSPGITGTHSRKGSYVPSSGMDRTSEELPGMRKAYAYGSREEGLDDSVGDGEAGELMRDLEAFDMLLDMDGNGQVEGRGGASEVRYEGPFQPPVGKEMVVIIASLVGVLVLAVAAGFTTVYDWVL